MQNNETLNNDKTNLKNLFHLACKEGDVQSLEYLLTRPDLKTHAALHDNFDLGVQLACESGHTNVVKFLLEFPKLFKHADQEKTLKATFKAAFKAVNLDTIKYLVSNIKEEFISSSTANQGLSHACTKGRLDIVQYLFTTPKLKEKVDINYDETNLLSLACGSGNMDLVKYMLTSPELTQHSTEFYNCIEYASTNGHLEIVKYLLELPHLDRQEEINTALRESSSKGHFHITEYLLTAPKFTAYVDSHMEEDIILRNACMHGNVDAVRFMLTSEKLTDKNYEYIDEAFKEALPNHNDVVFFLLNSPEFQNQTKYKENNITVLLQACENSDIDFINTFLNTPELVSNTNLHAKYDALFKKLYEKEDTELLNTLVFEHNLPLTQRIEKFLTDHNEDDLAVQLLQTFKSRDSYHSLNQQLKKQSDKPYKKMKV